MWVLLCVCLQGESSAASGLEQQMFKGSSLFVASIDEHTWKPCNVHLQLFFPCTNGHLLKPETCASALILMCSAPGRAASFSSSRKFHHKATSCNGYCMAERSAYALKMVLAMVVCQRVSLQCHVVVAPLGAGEAVFADRKQVFYIGCDICTCICNSRYWHPLSKLAPYPT